MSKLHKFECILYVSIEFVIATICCFSALACDDWLKIVLLVISALFLFYHAVSGVLYIVKKAVLDSISET